MKSWQSFNYPIMVLSRKDESKLNSVLLYEQGRRKYRSRFVMGVKAYNPIAVSN